LASACLWIVPEPPELAAAPVRSSPAVALAAKVLKVGPTAAAGEEQVDGRFILLERKTIWEVLGVRSLSAAMLAAVVHYPPFLGTH